MIIAVSTVESPSPVSDASVIPYEGIATLVFLALGLFYWFCYRVRSSSSANSSVSSPAKLHNERFATFVEQQISFNDIVLFVASEKYLETFQTLFVALKVTCHVVDLTRTAGGKRVLEALQEKHRKEIEEEQQEFLFIRGKLLGDFQQLRELLINGKKDELGAQCDWSSVRVDRKSKTGFMILDAQHKFQCVRDVKKTFEAMETKPLHTTTELEHFDATTMIGCSVPIALPARMQRRRSKLLVCHDMKGGYQEDRFKQGSNDFDAYRFYQWDLVDTFVYFGHALVCPPPTGWIVAGHRHGTRVLGTFLTEGEEGAKICGELFFDVHSAERFALKLAAIALHGGFDGWLINVENDVPAELVTSIDVFLRTLRKKMQLQNFRAQVVWYGSLSEIGKKKSCVRLDEASAGFFSAVDAFYADYGWVSDDAKFSAAFDLDRRYAVYMGIDVFGRHNTLGGGKMNCGEPLRLVWNSGVSAALFAPGWTYECYQHEEKKDFVIVENRFWQTIRDSWKVKSPCYDALGGQNCLYSAFNIGRGVGIWAEGKRVGASTWSNMAEMDVQPNQALHVGSTAATGTGSMEAVISHTTAFHGGACVKCQGHLVGQEKSYFKLFDVDIEFSPRRVMEISYTTATREESVCLLVLTVCPGLNRATHHVILRSMSESDLEDGGKRADHKKALSAIAKATSEKHFYLPVSTEFFDIEGTDADAVSGITSDGWCKKTYRLGGQLWDQKHIVEIGVLCVTKERKTRGESDKYLAYVGEVCVVGSNSKLGVKGEPCNVHSQPQCCENAKITSFQRHDVDSVSFGVQWDYEANGVPVRYVLAFACTEDGEYVFVGKSFDKCLQVNKFAWQQSPVGDRESLSPLSSRLTIKLQSVSWAGQRSKSNCLLHIEE